MGTYRELHEALERQLHQLAQLPELKGPNLQRLIDKLRTNRFNLVVLGGFKPGKSTLINALLGEAVLPTAILPLFLGLGGNAFLWQKRRSQIWRNNLRG